MTRPAGLLAAFNNKEVTVVAKKKTLADAARAAVVQEQVATQPARRTVRRLGFKERTLLAQAMEARREELLGDCPHLADVAVEMSKVLGFQVTMQHVRTGMEDSGVSWGVRRRKGTWPLCSVGRFREKVWDAIRLVGQCESDPEVADDYARAVEAAEVFCEAARELYRKCYLDGTGEADAGMPQAG